MSPARSSHIIVVVCLTRDNVLECVIQVHAIRQHILNEIAWWVLATENPQQTPFKLNSLVRTVVSFHCAGNTVTNRYLYSR